MGLYIKTIQFVQKNLLMWSIVLFLFVLPWVLAFSPELATSMLYTALFNISLGAVTFVMLVRPLADIFQTKWLRILVTVRKGFGVLSASIIVGFMLSKIIIYGGAYFWQFITMEYWSMERFKLLAHLGDITGVILLATSNKFSRRALGVWWKRVQKLSYVYFYTGAFYEVLALNNFFAVVAISLVTVMSVIALIINNTDRKNI